MSRPYKLIMNLMSLWGITLSTCMPNVGVWQMLGDCSARCIPTMRRHEMPCLEDMPWMGMGQKLLHIFEQMCEEGVQISHVTFVYIISSCSH